MRWISLAILILLNLGIAGVASPTIANEEYTIGNELNPVILDKFPLPKEFSYAGMMAVDKNNHLWISGSEFITDKDGKRERKSKIAVFDIGAGIPKILTIYDTPPGSTGQFGLCDQHIYLAYMKSQTPSEKQNIPISRCGFTIFDVHDPGNPTPVGKTDKLSNRMWKMHIDESSKTMYVFDIVASGSMQPGMTNQTTIYKFSLQDPRNPKLIPCKIMDYAGKEIGYIEGYVNEVIQRDEFLYVMTNKKLYALYSSPDQDIRIISQNEGGFSSLDSFCLADEYLEKDDVYIFASGRSKYFSYPGEKHIPRRLSYTYGISLLSHHSGFSSLDPYIGTHPTQVRIPFSPEDIYSKGTLVYVTGKEINETLPRQQVNNDKFLVVDFTMLSDPKFAGSIEFDGWISDWIIKERKNKTYAYLVISSKGNTASDRKNTLITLELPMKEGVFQHEYMSMEEMYPGYKEPEIKPNPIESSLRDIIDKPEGQLSATDFKDIKALDFENQKLTDINGLELCADLEELNLTGNHVNDIDQLSNLKKLKNLDLRYNKITNLEPLGNLSNLEELNLYANKITDISPLLDLPNLKKLNLSSNKISDLTPVSKLTNLTDLKLGYCNIFRPPSFADLKNLKVLNLMGNDIYHMDFIEDLPSGLEDLNLYGNNIKSINSFSHLPELTKLNLQNNNLKDINSIKDLTNLEELKIANNKKLNDFSPLANLTNLKKLDISELYIDDISFLKDLVNLEELYIQHINMTPKKISDLKPLSNMRKLKILQAGQNEIESIKPLENLPELTYLDFEFNRIKSLDGLKNASNLEKMDFSNNKIKNIDAIANLEKLKDATLFKNEIKDVTSLLDGKISPDCTVTIGGNQISDEQLNKLRKKMVVYPNENEGNALNNLIAFAASQTEFFKSKDKYATDIKELVTSGFLLQRGNLEKFSLDGILSRYDVALLDVSDKKFTVVMFPEKDVVGRIFAINEEGIVYEWLGDKKPDLSKLDFSDSTNWKHWPKESRFSVYSCGTGG